MPDLEIGETDEVTALERPTAFVVALVPGSPELLKIIAMGDLLYRDGTGVFEFNSANKASAFGYETKRLDIILDEVDNVAPEQRWIGKNTRWLAAIDIAHNLVKGTNFVSLGLDNIEAGKVMDLWMTFFRGFHIKETTAAAAESVVLQIDDTIGIEEGMLVEAVGIANPLPFVLEINDATHVTISRPVTVANGVMVEFYDNPTFGFGITPPSPNSYRAQFGPPDTEPTMGGVGSRVGPAQTGYAYAAYTSDNVHLWGVLPSGMIDPAIIRARAGSDVVQEYWKNDLTATYQVRYVGNSIRWRYASGDLDLFQFNTDGTGNFFHKITFDKGIVNKADGGGVVQTIQKADGSVNYTWRYSGNDLILRYATGGVDALKLGTNGEIELYKPTRSTPVTVASLPAAGTPGRRAFVSDSSVAASGNFGAIVAGGGSNNVPVHDNGTNWRIG